MSTRLRAVVVADAVTRHGDRITTLELTFPRFLLPEFNTHRAFSRNSASSRARSVKKTIAEVRNDPFVPWHWPTEQVGMAGGPELTELDRSNAERLWWVAAHTACEDAEQLVVGGVHKSIVNRLLEPFMWHTVVVTSTAWDNFFTQRLALLDDGRPAAEPHFHDLALAMQREINFSRPTELQDEQWHLPYVPPGELDRIANDTRWGPHWMIVAIKLSVARCAGVSYLNQSAQRSYERDLALCDRLIGASPPHWSPFEHVARPARPTVGDAPLVSPRRDNLTGWESLRWLLESGGAQLSDLEIPT